MVIGSPEGLRTVAKIAYVGLAHLVGVQVAAGEVFRDVRQLILQGKPGGVARFFVNNHYPEGCQQGPHPISDYHRFARGVPLRSICALFFRLRSPKTVFIVG
jgi:hypothetical protein